MWALPAWLLAGLAVWLITGPVWSTAPLKPDPKRISPAQGWRRLFSAKAAVEWLKALVKLAVLVGIAWAVGRGAWASMQRASVAGVEAVARMGVKLAAEFFAYTAAALVALALLDGLYQRWQHRRELRMTPKELKDEYKETEGDPQIKARIREMQAQISRRRMMAEVPKADVVVVNPTHLAVALRYRHGRDPAPRVVAKGRERTAQRIREIARAHRVPIRHDPPLARALIRVPLGKPIPEALYEAVARVLAEIYRARTPPTEA
ncbi:MAG: EscU/YscU/HrcU family type III secretion system export apparatus switch protein [Zetaproteobacteria bacterium]|nr:MAG: EscU/YscU/HrcU family type III secretion system export apparatus switch protein [Zetaproteobacteria bacterium]